MTIMSGFMARRFRAVSARVSPLVVELEEVVMLTVSAESLFPAISKDVLVRVDAS
jgi:hypothetical protein